MKYLKHISENFNSDEDVVYSVIYEEKVLGLFTSDLKAKEAIKQYVDSIINSYQVKDIESIEEYKQSLIDKAIILNFKLDRLYDDRKIEKSI